MIRSLFQRVRRALGLQRSLSEGDIKARRARQRADQEAMDRRARVHFWEIYRFRRWR